MTFLVDDREAEAASSAVPDSADVQLADRIARGIFASNAAPGTVIASQQELRALHEAGRAVLRQAVRILEERGIAKMRRGFGGGLVVAEPNADFAARALSIVLESLGSDTQQSSVLLEAVDTHLFVHGAPRLGLEQCAELLRAVQRLNRLPDDEFLRSGAHRQLHRAIRIASGEPAVLLAYGTAFEYGLDLIPYRVNVVSEAAKGEAWQITCDTATALVAGDMGKMFDCRRRQREMFLANWGKWEAIARDPLQLPQLNDQQRPEFELTSNRAERLAREILREIRLLDWKPGARIGSGSELMSRYGASANILRQAVRTLQEHAAVDVEKGRSGGLFIAVPDRQRAIERARFFLQNSAATALDIKAFLLHLILETLEQTPPIAANKLRDDMGTNNAVSFIELCKLVAKISANPVTQVFTDILAPLLPNEQHTVAASIAREALLARDTAQRRRLILAVANGNVMSQA
ncbi:MAG: GntR family transcriptional regulator [Verrucomicrobiaceae bacterium]|nr:GntR family transcriptional regulator [Verrucomicrobiaceae bacterium]